MVERRFEEPGVVSSILTSGTSSECYEWRREEYEGNPDYSDLRHEPKLHMQNFFTGRFTTIQNYFATQQLPGTELKRLFSWSFWTEADISPDSSYMAATLVFIALVLISLLFWRSFLKQQHRRVPVYSTPIAALTNLVFFIIIMTIGYLFFRNQSLAYASSRLIVLGSLLISLGWLGWIFWQIARTVPSAEASYLERERFFRYLPKKQGKN